MNMPIGYWVGVAVLDAILRILYTIIGSLNILLIPFMLWYTAIHLLCLIPTNLVAILLGFRERIAVIIVLLITNSLFCVIFAVSWVNSIRSGRQSVCEGYQYKCKWIDGVITDLGVQALTRECAIQVGINLASVLFIWLLAAEANKTIVGGGSMFQLPAGWHLAAVGDFNGDGKAGILSVHDNGAQHL